MKSKNGVHTRTPLFFDVVLAAGFEPATSSFGENYSRFLFCFGGVLIRAKYQVNTAYKGNLTLHSVLVIMYDVSGCVN